VTVQLPTTRASDLPDLIARSGEVSHRIRDVCVAFRLRFHSAEQALAFKQRYRFMCPRSALRDEGAGLLWIAFHAWAFDIEEAQLQAALSIRWAATRAHVRHIPVATDAECRDCGTPADELRALRERIEMLDRLNDPAPAMFDTQHNAMTSHAPPVTRQLAAGPAPLAAASSPPPAPAPRRRRRPWPRRG
jgi:hypothetical protein